MLWQNLRQDEFRDAVKKANGVCVIPIGCIESHGIHCPLGCDNLTAQEYAARAAEKAEVVVFPTMWFGEKSGADEFPGTVIFPESLIDAILRQCCREIGRNGFKKIIILNGHGGNAALLQNFARSILQEKCDYMVYVANIDLPFPRKILAEIEKYPYLTKEDISVLEDYETQGKKGGHGCFSETGLLYDVCPDLVRLDLMDAVDGNSVHRFDEFGKYGIYTPFTWMANYPNSLGGTYHAGMNARIAKAMGEHATEAIAQAFEFIKNETVSDEYRKAWLEKNPHLKP
jgi:creatinine amidohydrolase